MAMIAPLLNEPDERPPAPTSAELLFRLAAVDGFRTQNGCWKRWQLIQPALCAIGVSYFEVKFVLVSAYGGDWFDTLNADSASDIADAVLLGCKFFVWLMHFCYSLKLRHQIQISSSGSTDTFAWSARSQGSVFYLQRPLTVFYLHVLIAICPI